MTHLEELIQYWKDKLPIVPTDTTGRDKEAVRNTIAALEELKDLKEA